MPEFYSWESARSPGTWSHTSERALCMGVATEFQLVVPSTKRCPTAQKDTNTGVGHQTDHQGA